MVILIGKTGSGKDTILNELIHYGYTKMVSYTTRPIRKGEKQDIDYHFITKNEFIDKIDTGFFLVYETYNIIEGEWYYGSSKEDFINSTDNTIAILAPDGYKQFKQKVNFPHKSLYIYAANTTIKQRLIKRGDNKEEIERRIKADNNDFKGMEMEVDRIFYNNDDTKISDVVNNIIKWLKK